MTKEIIWIRKRQQEFERIFGRQLLIDFDGMVGVRQDDPIRKSPRSGLDNKQFYKTNLTPDRFLLKLLDENGADIEKVKSDLRKTKYSPERAVLVTFCKAVMANHWDPKYCGRLINKSRETIYYYASKLEF